MTFDEILSQVTELLHRQGRVSYRALKRRFSLDDEYLEDLKDELIKAQQLAKDEEGAVLVWAGTAPVSGSPLPDPKRQTLDPRRDVGERRQLTVMFCDLVDSTTLSEQLDPEEWRALVKEYQGVCAEIIRRFDGHIAQYVGDGLLVYFGHPVAHEDDAQRAARSGLEIVAELQQRNGRVESAVGVRHVAPLQPEAIPLFASLLSIPLPTHYPPLTGTPQRQKQKTLEALLVWLLKEAERQPVLMVMEDLHWVDPSTQEFLSLLIDQVSTARLLIVLTFRPDFSPPWVMLSHMRQLTLSRLGRKQVEAMVGEIAGGKTLPAEVLQQMVAKTDGVPLFVEELTKTVLESGLDVGATGRSSLLLTIPVTLHDSLMARLDRMNTAKEVAQLGATIGREFTYELIQSVSSVDEKTLQSALVKLVEAELLYQRGLPPQARYIFKHALIQDAAYQSLLKSTRQHYHQQIAQVLRLSKKSAPEKRAVENTGLFSRKFVRFGVFRQSR